MFLYMTVDDRHKFADIIIIDGNLHTLSAKYIRRTDQNRISQFVGSGQSFFCGEYSFSCRTRNLTGFQNLIEKFTVFCCIYIFCTGTKNRYTHFQKSFRQLDGGLSTKLYNSTIRFFNINDIFHIFRCQRFKI